MSHSRAPQPFVLDEDDVLDYESGRKAASELNRRRVDARKNLEEAIGERIDKETEYRKDRATKRLTVEGADAAARKDALESATVDSWAAKEKAQMKVDIFKEKLEEIDGQRASLHRLIEWSARLDPHASELSAQRRAA